jgi:hypothetical protein
VLLGERAAEAERELVRRRLAGEEVERVLETARKMARSLGARPCA